MSRIDLKTLESISVNLCAQVVRILIHFLKSNAELQKRLVDRRDQAADSLTTAGTKSLQLVGTWLTIA